MRDESEQVSDNLIASTCIAWQRKVELAFYSNKSRFVRINGDMTPGVYWKLFHDKGTWMHEKIRASGNEWHHEYFHFFDKPGNLNNHTNTPDKYLDYNTIPLLFTGWYNKNVVDKNGEVVSYLKVIPYSYLSTKVFKTRQISQKRNATLSLKRALRKLEQDKVTARNMMVQFANTSEVFK